MVVKVSDVDVNLVKKTLIINPALLKKHWKELSSVYKSIKSREQETIYEEVLKQDRFKLDKIILGILSLSDCDVRELHKEACKYVKDREEKAESLTLSKSKQKLDYEDSLQLIQDRFPEVIRYKKLINGTKVQRFDIPEWNAKYPKGGIGSENLFGIYNVYFVDGKAQKILSFNSINQINLFEFFNKTLDIKNTKLDLPVDEGVCSKIQQQLEKDFSNYSFQIKSFLKSNRSSANYISIYRDLLFSK
jgi:hypothetical protein